MNSTPTEFQEQVTFVEFLERMMQMGKIKAFTAIPQNMWTKSIQQKVKAKREGVRPGFPDMVVVTNNGHVLFIEMKRTKGGRVRVEQGRWLEILDDKHTVSFVAYGAREAMNIVNNFTSVRQKHVN